jgi:hypothetical protein
MGIGQLSHRVGDALQPESASPAHPRPDGSPIDAPGANGGSAVDSPAVNRRFVAPHRLAGSLLPLIWVLSAGAGVFLARFSTGAALSAVLLGGLAALVTFGESERRPSTLGLAALVGATAFAVLLQSDAAWIAAAALMGLLHTPVALAKEDAPDEVHRHIARCRRLEQPAEVMVAISPRTARHPRTAWSPPTDWLHRWRSDWCRSAAGALRLTDSVEIPPGRAELRAVLDGASLDRASVERRLVETLDAHQTGSRLDRRGSPSEVAFGWARFPEDGFTFEVLAQRAHDRAVATHPYMVGDLRVAAAGGRSSSTRIDARGRA